MKAFGSVLGFVLGLSAAFADEPVVKVTCPRGSHQYEVGERAEFEVTSERPGAVVRIAFTRGNLRAPSTMTTTTPVRVSYALNEPGFIVCRVRAKQSDGSFAKEVKCGAGFNVHDIRPALPPPKDYDEFWKSAFAEQDAIAPDFTVRPLSNDVELISCKTVWNTRMYAFLHIPKGDGPFPLRVSVGGGNSIYAFDSVCADAANSRQRAFLCLHLPAWEPMVPASESREYHREWLKRNGIKDSIYNWNADKGPRERWFYRCILGCCRLTEYAATRPRIDRKRVYYTGGSTGGGYGFFIAAFSPYIKAAVCEVPNYGNASGPSAGRPSGEDDRGAHWQTSLYYDAAYCAPRITCPVFVSCGYIDDSCTPETVYCTYNALRCRKVMYDKVENGHGGDRPPGYDAVRNAWLFSSFGM